MTLHYSTAPLHNKSVKELSYLRAVTITKSARLSMNDHDQNANGRDQREEHQSTDDDDT